MTNQLISKYFSSNSKKLFQPKCFTVNLFVINLLFIHQLLNPIKEHLGPYLRNLPTTNKCSSIVTFLLFNLFLSVFLSFCLSAQSKHTDAKGEEPNRRLKKKDKEPSRKKNTKKRSGKCKNTYSSH